MRLRRWLLAASLAAVNPSVPAPGGPPVTIHDDAGRTVILAHPARRIVSLLPSLTETVCALGACDRLVATDRYSDWPDEVQRLPKAGGLEDAQIEEVVRLRPDVVLLSRTQRIGERLSELGIESVALDTQTYESIAHTVNTIGAIIGQPERAASLNLDIEKSVNEASAAARAHRGGNHPSVYFEVDRAPYAAGPKSFIGEMLERLGARNIVTADLGTFPRLNPEYVVRANPDVIILSTDAASIEDPNFSDRPGWSQIRAVREKRVCSFPMAVREVMVRPGPRMADGMRAIEDCLERVSP